MARRYEWDEKKNRSNRAKRGFTFQVAAKVFLDPNALERQDREVDGEQRWQTIGHAGAILTVAHTIRQEGIDEVIRIISARKANQLTTSDREDLKRLAAMPDDRIDTSDIPDSGGRKGWSRVPASRPATRQIAAAETR